MNLRCLTAAVSLALSLATVSAFGQCQEVARLFRPNPLDNDQMGIDIAIGTMGVCVGAPNAFETPGTVEFYRKEDGNWLHAQSIAPSDEFADSFGVSCAVDGQILVVGAQFTVVDGQDSAGAAYVYRYDGAQWQFEQKLTASDAATSDQFGTSVDVEGNRVLIGAKGGVHGSTPTGAAYVFEYDADTWVEVQKVTPSDGVVHDQFGYRVVLNDDLVVASAIRHDAMGSDSGAVYVFRHDGTAFSQEAKLLSSNGAADDFFGQGLDAEGNRIVVGSTEDDSFASDGGAVYTFTWDGSAWTEEQKLGDDDPQPGALFGWDVHVIGDQIIVGAVFDTVDGFWGVGSIQVFESDGSTWSHVETVHASDNNTGESDNFGWSVDALGERAVVGAPFHDGQDGWNQGAGYVFHCGPPQDTDGDGLLDSWETDGIDINNDGIIDLDLPALGADPMRKDLFLEVDVMQNVTLEPYVIDSAVQCFELAPNENPDGTFGINLHIDMGTADTFAFQETWDDNFINFGIVKNQYFGTIAERNDPNWEHIRAARQRVFRYAAICNKVAIAGGWGELPGNDFYMMAGGGAAGDAHWQAVTFIHELGHNLGLHHGGGDGVNRKPNYISVMNYAFHDFRDSSNRKLFPDFSWEPLLPLIENNLDETIGLTSTYSTDVFALHGYRNPGEQPQWGWVQLNNNQFDWNRDGQLEQGVIVDLNWVPTNDPSPGQTMNGFNDWPTIIENLPIGTTGSYADGQHVPPPHDEETYEEVAERQELIPPPPVNLAALNDLTVVFGDVLDGDLNDLAASDQQDLELRSEPGFSAVEPDIIRIVVGATTEIESASSLGVVFEGRLTHPNGVTRLLLKDWASNQFVQQTQFNLGFTEEQQFVKDVPATNYVRDTDGRIEVAVHQYVAAVFSALGFYSHIDRIEISVRPE